MTHCYQKFTPGPHWLWQSCAMDFLTHTCSASRRRRHFARSPSLVPR